jgi:hypothetical protein
MKALFALCVVFVVRCYVVSCIVARRETAGISSEPLSVPPVKNIVRNQWCTVSRTWPGSEDERAQFEAKKRELLAARCRRLLCAVRAGV